MTEIIQKVPIAANIFYFYFSDKLAEYGNVTQALRMMVSVARVLASLHHHLRTLGQSFSPLVLRIDF